MVDFIEASHVEQECPICTKARSEVLQMRQAIVAVLEVHSPDKHQVDVLRTVPALLDVLNTLLLATTFSTPSMRKLIDSLMELELDTFREYCGALHKQLEDTDESGG